MNSRVLRLSAATLLLGAATATLAPHMTSHISSAAIVNAVVLPIRAPYDGVVAVASGGFATAVAADAPLLRFEAERPDGDMLSAVEAEIAAIEAEVAAVETQTATVAALEADLRQRIASYDDAAGRYLAAARREATARQEQAETRRQLAEGEMARVSRLASAGSATSVALERVESEHRLAQAEVASSSARGEALDVETESLREGIALDASTDGGLYLRQRLDEVALQIADLTARRETLSGRLSALRIRRAAVAATLARRQTFEPISSVDGVVWRASPAAGTSIGVGDLLMEVLDCENRFLEVTLPARLFDEIQPGIPATVLFKGSAESFAARVEAVGGAGARFDHPSLASNSPDIGRNDVQVLVRLDAEDPSDPGVAASFCDVGRVAQVRIPRSRLGALDLFPGAGDRLRQWLPPLALSWIGLSGDTERDPDRS